MLKFCALCWHVDWKQLNYGFQNEDGKTRARSRNASQMWVTCILVPVTNNLRKDGWMCWNVGVIDGCFSSNK